MPTLASVVAASSLALTGVAAAPGLGYNPFNYGLNAPGMKWMSEAKFGLFIHNGPVTQWGTEISFPLVCGALPCTVHGPGNKPVTIHTEDELAAHRKAYADLATTYNPSEFNATAMAIKAKAAGMKYAFYTTVHCDGFINWDTQLTDYNIMNTPYGKDIFGEGLRVGAYVCPSLWNNDSYWAPNASTALGPVCAPNYQPSQNPAAWTKFTTYLHGLVTELATKYQPDAYWFDCSNQPPRTDTHLEQVAGVIRTSNPEATILARGGTFSDYVETTDQQEASVNSIVTAASWETAGVYFEVPSVLQTSHQWAFDPNSSYKPASEILPDLFKIVSRGGNYLVNVGPMPNGLWPQEAENVLDELGTWMSDGNAEGVFATQPSSPFQWGGISVTASQTEKAVYLLAPAGALAGVADPNGSDGVLLPWMRPQLMADTLQSVTVLGSGPQAGAKAFSFSSSGLHLNISAGSFGPTLNSYFSPVLNDTAPCAMRDCSIYTQDHFSLVREEGGCLPPTASGGDVVKLDLVFNQNREDNALSAPDWTPGAGYSDISPECYVYSAPPPKDANVSVVPLDSYFHPGRNDTWALASAQSRTEATAAGYSKTHTLGFILPAAATPTPGEDLGMVIKLVFE